MTRTITVCPKCDSSRIRRRHPEKTASQIEDPHTYRCDHCAHVFDQPETRVAQTSPKSRAPHHGLAKQLWETDPDTLETREEES